MAFVMPSLLQLSSRAVCRKTFSRYWTGRAGRGGKEEKRKKTKEEEEEEEVMATSPYGNALSSECYPKMVLIFAAVSFVFAVVNLVTGGST